MDARIAGPDDLAHVADTLALAFDADPAWSWVFDDPDSPAAAAAGRVGRPARRLGGATGGSG